MENAHYRLWEVQWAAPREGAGHAGCGQELVRGVGRKPGAPQAPRSRVRFALSHSLTAAPLQTSAWRASGE